MSDADYISTAPPYDRETPIMVVEKKKEETNSTVYLSPRQSPRLRDI
jgi:hypothetical protein